MSLHSGIASHHAYSIKKRTGKIAFSFTYQHNGAALKWNVSMTKASALQSGAGDKIVFFADVEVEGKRVVIVGDGPEEVRVETEHRLDEVTKVEWTNVLAVRVDPHWEKYSQGDRTTCEGAALNIAYETFQTGITPGGRKVHRGWTPPLVYEGYTNKPLFGRTIDQPAPAGTIIPHTPEAQAALDAICGALKSLGLKVRTLLAEKAILGTLANVTVLGLPVPENKEIKP